MSSALSDVKADGLFGDAATGPSYARSLGATDNSLISFNNLILLGGQRRLRNDANSPNLGRRRRGRPASRSLHRGTSNYHMGRAIRRSGVLRVLVAGEKHQESCNDDHTDDV